jgi:hypothetical protein
MQAKDSGILDGVLASNKWNLFLLLDNLFFCLAFLSSF